MASKYTPEQKALAVQTIRRFGGLTAEAIGHVRELLKNPSISKSTLHEWLKLYAPLAEANRTEPPRTAEPNTPERVKKPTSLLPTVTEEMMDEAEETLDRIFERTARNYLRHANLDKTLSETKGKDAVIAAATALDKMRLIRGLPTEIVSVVPDLLIINDLLRQQGKTLVDVIAVMKNKLTAGPLLQ